VDHCGFSLTLAWYLGSAENDREAGRKAGAVRGGTEHLHDHEVLSRYSGEFVVPYQHEIVAHGHSAAVVLAEAARITGRQAEELPLVGVIDPLLDIPHR
jgi:hypothetical protein